MVLACVVVVMALLPALLTPVSAQTIQDLQRERIRETETSEKQRQRASRIDAQITAVFVSLVAEIVRELEAQGVTFMDARHSAETAQIVCSAVNPAECGDLKQKHITSNNSVVFYGSPRIQGSGEWAWYQPVGSNNTLSVRLLHRIPDQSDVCKATLRVENTSIRAEGSCTTDFLRQHKGELRSAMESSIRTGLSGGPGRASGAAKMPPSSASAQDWSNVTLEQWLGGTTLLRYYKGQVTDKRTNTSTSRRLTIRTSPPESVDGQLAWKHVAKLGNLVTSNEVTYISDDGSIIKSLFDGKPVPSPNRWFLIPMSAGNEWQGAGYKCTVRDGGTVTTQIGSYSTLKRVCSGPDETLEDWLSPGMGIVRRIWTGKTMTGHWDLAEQK